MTLKCKNSFPIGHLQWSQKHEVLMPDPLCSIWVFSISFTRNQWISFHYRRPESFWQYLTTFLFEGSNYWVEFLIQCLAFKMLCFPSWGLKEKICHCRRREFPGCCTPGKSALLFGHLPHRKESHGWKSERSSTALHVMEMVVLYRMNSAKGLFTILSFFLLLAILLRGWCVQGIIKQENSVVIDCVF